MHKKIFILGKLAALLSFAAATNTYANANDVCQNNTTFNVGAGIYDITGPAAEEGMMGYGMLNQKTAGISSRLWARAFVIESPCNNNRVVIVNTDLGQVFQSIKQQVVAKLKQKYGNRFDDKNILISATHTHSGPGGYSTYTFYNITTLGFSRDNFNVIIDGIVNAIERAQNNLAPAQIKMATGDLSGISFNRSPQAYLLNPTNERARYQTNVDTQMTLLRFDRLDGKPIGMINWFPIHGVSMNNKNYLISSDNKGYAEYLFEKDFRSDNGPHAFVAAFAQANAGDVSPNEYGHEGGSGNAGLQAVQKAGTPQYITAKKLYDQATTLVTGGIDYRHQFVKMDEVTVEPVFGGGYVRQTCPAAIGVSMLAGTQDGEGIGWQGISCNDLSGVFSKLACEMVTTSCQGVKPIAVSTGTKSPYPWTPNILPYQVIKLGNVVIAAAPFELTTMTGRRIRETVKAQFSAHENNHVVLSALANAYSGYVATNEEYQMQRYEGASTHFGPWTAAALQQEFAKLTLALTQNKPVSDGPTPLDLSGSQINLQTGVVFDDKPPFTNFGDVHLDVNKSYQPGETVEVVFWGGHPKNNYRTMNTFLAVQHYENGEWKPIRRDNNPDTEYRWERSGVSYSLVTIAWHVPQDAPTGRYRIVHYGEWKSGWTRNIYPYAGLSSEFVVS
ncbi:MAG: hypothetical protein ACD_46C00403G0001 [uncultured bacterium]|nr:MAG: hypothetical protein ACD_46C00403G0001 [uncultured bacterium]